MIEAVHPTELTQLVTLSRKTFAATFETENNRDDIARYLDEQLTETKLKQELANPNSEFYFAKVNEKVVGYLKLNVATAQTERDYPMALEIQRIYVLNTYQKIGIGKQLMAWAVQRATQLNKPLIWLGGVWEHNLSAQRFYAQAGFIRTTEYIFTIGNSKQTDWIMTKTLEDK